ncbi:MAG: transposase, partial [Desulfobacterales bacterium]|nr:transposase [Desulfobacterales bacterium]
MVEVFFKKFKIGTLLNRSNITKTKGVSPSEIFLIIFNLAFVRKNIFYGIIKNKKVLISKDVVYEFLKNESYNWRRLNLLLVSKIYILIKRLLDNSSEEVFIIDDSPYDRSRSKKVELLSRVFDHASRKFLKGFRMLTLGWSDGNSFLGIDFALLSSSKKSNRYQEATKNLDKRSSGYKRRMEAILKMTEHLEPMVKRALSIGIRAKYILMDSWFSSPITIATLRKHIHVICMLKDYPNWHYTYKGKKLRLSDVYKKLKKTRGKTRIKASVIVTCRDGNKSKIIFVSDNNKRGWLALLSTDLKIANEEIIRLYGKRWDIEVFFKMTKQYLKLVKGIQSRDYDSLIAYTTVVITRYNFLSFYQRQYKDQRTYGSLFRCCCQEMENIKFIDALQRIISLALRRIKKDYELSKNIIMDMIDTIMGSAIQFFGLKVSKCT